MQRRDLLKAVSLGASALAMGAIPVVGQEAARSPAIAPGGDRGAGDVEVDVLVVGGGTAGTVAANQAGRTGAKTALVELTGQLGGAITNGGVDFPGLFHAWGRQGFVQLP